jgi:DNA-binding transcriptional regulator YiaG
MDDTKRKILTGLDKITKNDMIDDVIDDLKEFGQAKKVTVLYDRKTAKVSDYILQEDSDKEAFEDEIATQEPLLDLLVELLSYQSHSILGAVLKAHRTALDMAQIDVAEALGVNLRSYQKWEGGERIPDGRNMLALIKLLKISDKWQNIN